MKQIADLGRLAWQARGIELPSDPDVATLAIDRGMACLRRSTFARDAITPRYREAAADVMIAFLAPHIDQAWVRSPVTGSPGTCDRAGRRR